MTIAVGCCGFPVSRKLYYENFNCCEIQKTFYTFPKISLLGKWRKEAPADFSFIIKASQIITHPASSPTYKRFEKKSFPSAHYDEKKFGSFQPSKEVKIAWEEVLKEAEALKSKIIIFQTPPSFQEDAKNIENIYSFFSTIERRGLTLVWEARGNWQDETLMKISCDLNLILACDPTQKVFAQSSSKKRKTPFDFYFRLHGGRGYRHKFTDEELLSLAKLIKKKCGYIMFNNISMFEDARRMKKILREIA